MKTENPEVRHNNGHINSGATPSLSAEERHHPGGSEPASRSLPSAPTRTSSPPIPPLPLVPAQHPTPNAANHLDLARKLLPASVRNRRFRANSFAAQLTAQQLS